MATASLIQAGSGFSPIFSNNSNNCSSRTGFVGPVGPHSSSSSSSSSYSWSSHNLNFSPGNALRFEFFFWSFSSDFLLFYNSLDFVLGIWDSIRNVRESKHVNWWVKLLWRYLYYEFNCILLSISYCIIDRRVNTDIKMQEGSSVKSFINFYW